MSVGYEFLVTCPDSTESVEYVVFNKVYSNSSGIWDVGNVSLASGVLTCEDKNGSVTNGGTITVRPLGSADFDYAGGGAAFAFGFIVPLTFYLIAKPVGVLFRILKQS